MTDKIIIPTKKEIDKQFNKVMETIEDTDFEDFKTVFYSGIDLMIKLNEEKSIMVLYNELGFDVDVNDVYKLITDSDISEEIDELYGLEIDFTDVLFNADNSSTREMTIYFELSDGRSGTFDGNAITIDSKGRVYCRLVESPWEGGGVESEIEEILMKYVAKQKY